MQTTDELLGMLALPREQLWLNLPITLGNRMDATTRDQRLSFHGFLMSLRILSIKW
jgi:hypothetical protein